MDGRSGLILGMGQGSWVMKTNSIMVWILTILVVEIMIKALRYLQRMKVLPLFLIIYPQMQDVIMSQSLMKLVQWEEVIRAVPNLEIIK